MKKLSTSALSLLFTITFIFAGTGSNKLSPSLTEYLDRHAEMKKLADAILDKGVKVSFFHQDIDKSVFQSRASHVFVNERLHIRIRENQHPYDQLLCLLFEAENSKNALDFLRVTLKAKNAEIFADRISCLEHKAVVEIQSILPKLHPSSDDVANSEIHNGWMGSPIDCDEANERVKSIDPVGYHNYRNYYIQMWLNGEQGGGDNGTNSRVIRKGPRKSSRR